MKYDKYYQARNFMVHYLRRDLMGPYSDDEKLIGDPTVAYICGILYPRRPPTARRDIGNSSGLGVFEANHTLAEGDNVGLEIDGDDESGFEIPVALANTKNPSSIATTFQVDARYRGTLSVTVSAARYVQTEASYPEFDTFINDPDNDSDNSTHWRRMPIGPENFEIDLNTLNTSELTKIPIRDGLEFFGKVRSVDSTVTSVETPVIVITVGLTNILTSDFENIGSNCFFQPVIEIQANDGSAIFVERPAPTHLMGDRDYQSSRLLYEHSRSFAVGHGCSATWIANENGSRATQISTAVIPEKDVALTDSDSKIDAAALDMLFLTTSSKEEVLSALRDFLEGYKDWILGKETLLGQMSDSSSKNTGELHMEDTVRAAERMKKGIDLLESDQAVWNAFLLANRAMLITRSRTDWLNLDEGSRPNDPVVAYGSIKWRPFQLGFILMCASGIGNPNDIEDRKLVDLLWFPTGGGKTEAYLGVIAFTIFLRRLSHGNAGSGVTVLMRYTMRLLTIQQFQRASLLICACEWIRQNNADLGDSPITIGLYVGGNSTPNQHRSIPYFGMVGTTEALAASMNGQDLEGANPIQHQRCPWCGEGMDYNNYSVESPGGAYPSDTRELYIRCTGPNCPFSDTSSGRLPIFVVDEDIYRRRPSFLIATVDKFANLPWNPDGVSSLFNVDSDQLPPELIIQDELHLISGPLGTLTGLYESAIERLCRGLDGSKPLPKIIASTATIRKADAQCRTIFDRPVFQFPPPGLDSRDSYFSVEMAKEERGSRLYLGLFAPGTSATTLLVRTYAALLQGAKEMEAMEGLDEEILDAYWTMVGYFNARRLLGSALLQVQDDVADRIGVLASHTGAAQRNEINHLELSGRVTSSEINDILQTLNISKGAEQCLDVVLATNMISVGIDINRLGLMSVMGQPSNWSEYVQATSRVGRQYPGLVVVMLNAFKSRDRSHYESFESNHGALYQHVEGTTATPFSPRARDKALHAVVIGLARVLVPELRENTDASKIAEFRDAVQNITDGLVIRASSISKEHEESVKNQISSILDSWQKRAQTEPELEYDNRRKIEHSLMFRASENKHPDLSGTAGDAAFATMQSLRNVDTESSLFFTPS